MTVTNLAGQSERVATDLTEYLERLPAEDWTKPSDCAGWSIADLVAHLVLVEALLSSSIERGLGGDSGAPPHAAGGLAGWREYRAREIARLSGLPPAELLGQYRAGLGDMRRALATLAGADPGAAKGWHPSAGEQPVAWFAGQWLVEIALHDWDLRVALDPRAEVSAAAQAGLGPEMRSRMRQCVPAGEDATDGVVRIALDGPAPFSWLAKLDTNGLELLEDGAAEPAATIETDAGTYALVQTGRRPASAFAGSGRWRVSGDAGLADGLASRFRGY